MNVHSRAVMMWSNITTSKIVKFMGQTWGPPVGPKWAHVGPMNLAISDTAQQWLKQNIYQIYHSRASRGEFIIFVGFGRAIVESNRASYVFTLHTYNLLGQNISYWYNYKTVCPTKILLSLFSTAHFSFRLVLTTPSRKSVLFSLSVIIQWSFVSTSCGPFY